MIVQDVITLPTFNPHGGPITHSSTGSKPNSPVHPRFPKLFLVRDLVCNPRATLREIINSGIRHNTYSRCFEPLSHVVSGIERLPTRLKLLRVPPYFTLDILRFSSRVTFRHLPRCYQQVSQPCRGLFSQPLYSFVSTVKVPEERMTT